MTKSLPYADLISESIEQHAVFPTDPANLYDPIRYILNLSGKRIRPLLVMLSGDLFGHENMDELVPAALAIEFFHNFSLIHDDIMDEAPLRRGAPTVHQKWDNNVAILSGDALLVKAYEEIAKSPTTKIPSLLKVFNQVALEVCEGQQRDMDFEQLNSVSEEEYIHMIRAKTSVLLGGALKMGAILADASEADQKRIYDFGVNLGIAFQLQDDILDVYGDPENFGKQVGGDILSDKKTILRVKLQQLLDEEDKTKLISTQFDDPQQKISRMKDLYAKYDVRTLANDLKKQYSNRAFTSLADIDVSNERKNSLKMLGESLMNRIR